MVRLDGSRARALCLAITIFLLLLHLGVATGVIYYNMFNSTGAAVNQPPVVLQSGTAGSSTIYANGTSAKVIVEAINWWNTVYDYRRQISIANNINSTLDSGYSVCLTLNTTSLVSSSRMLSSGNDLRIVWLNGSSWVEMDRDVIDMNTSSTQVWFKTQAEIGPSPETDNNYFMYYGNPSAENPPTNRSKVYLWFDDFSTNTTDNYDIDRHANAWHGSAGNVYKPYWDSANNAVYFDTGDNYAGGWIPEAINETDVYAEMKMRITGSYPTNTTNGILLRWQDKDTFYGGHISGDSYESPCLVRDGRTTYIATKSPSEYHVWDQWFTIAVAVYGNDLKLWVDGTLKVSGTDTQITASGKISFLVAQSIGWMDDFKIRKYVDPEPSTSLGSEESNIVDYVENNISDVDSSPDKGTHSNFTEQQYTDSFYDNLTEQIVLSPISVTKYAVTGSTSEITGAPDQNYATIGKGRTCEVTDYQGGTDTIKQVYFNITYYGTVSGTLAWAYQLEGGGWNIIENLPEGGSALSPLTRTYNATSLRASWTWESLNTTDIQFQNNDDKGPEDAYVDAIYVTVVTEMTNYELDLEVQWINVSYTETYEELCIKTGTTGAENIKVDVWNGSTWITVFTDLTPNSWNNISVSSYLNLSNFTIRFKGGNETGDTTPDSWNIDATLLHVWFSESTYDYVLQVANRVADAWDVSLRVYNNSSIARISNMTISFHDGTTSDQIIITGGNIIQTEGPLYDLAGSTIIYIGLNNLQVSASGISYLYVYLKILVPETSTYTLYPIIFKIT